MNQKPLLLPANGIATNAYKPLENHLTSDFKSIQYPALDQPPPRVPNNLTWHLFYELINQNIDSSNRVGIGHSLGGTLLLYHALRHPDQWQRIIIIEPALFTPIFNYIYRIVRFFRLEYQTHPMIRITRRRRDQFESIQAVYERWRKNPSFQFISDECLRFFIDASLIKDKDHYTLRFPKQWEIEIYRSMCTLDPYIWQHLHLLKPKLIVVAGETSNTFLNGCRKKLGSFANDFITIPNTTHLLPFETPKALATIVNRELKEI